MGSRDAAGVQNVKMDNKTVNTDLTVQHLSVILKIRLLAAV